MEFERIDYYRDLQNLDEQCKKYLYYHVILTMTDGTMLDGIIEDVGTGDFTMLVGEEVAEAENQIGEQRQYHNYYYPRRQFRRFNRSIFPINRLASIALLPYLIPPNYPYY